MVVKLEISASNQSVTVEITSSGGNRKIRLGDRDILCDWKKLADGHYSLILDGKVWDLLISLEMDSCVVASPEGRFSFRLLDPFHRRNRQSSDERSAGAQQVTAEMPGKIVRVLVAAGDTVAFNQSLLVLEAMKMQNEIRAPRSGIVGKIAVAAGTTVNTGDFLLSLDS